MPDTRHTPILTNLCLRYVLLLRSLYLLGLGLGFLSMQQALHLHPPWRPFAVTLGLVLVFTLFSWWRMRQGLTITERGLLLQLLVDVGGLTLLLYWIGGSTNPLVSLFLLPVTVAAATLKARHIWLVAGTAMAGYSLLMSLHIPLSMRDGQGQDFEVHVWGMWLGFLLSAVLVAYFVSRIGATLRANDHALARAREEALQANQVIALGSLAAGTAHELGTPLATMAVLARELEQARGRTTEEYTELRLLRQQIDRCKEILSRMSAHAGQIRAEAGHRMSLDRYLEDLLREWRSIHPGKRLLDELSGCRPAPLIIAEGTLTQTITNLLNNASDAAPAPVTITAHWSETHLTLEIGDRGAGIPEHIRSELGKPFVTTKAPGKGLGLGLYLAHSTIDRLGGTLSIGRREDGPGSLARIELPLARILAATGSTP